MSFIAPFVALLLAAGSAAADVSDADRATARALASEGQKALEHQDFTTAADRFARADVLVHAPSLLLGLARAQAGLGKLISAQETYQRILREGLPPNPPAPFVRALEAAKEEVAALGPRIPYVTIRVEGAPGAVVTIDGAPVPSVAIGVKRPVDPGRHVFRAAAGSAVDEAVIEIGEGKAEVVTLTLREAAPVPVSLPPPPKVISRGTGSSPMRAGGIAALGVGGAGIVMGTVAGLVAVAQHGNLASKCNNGVCPASEQPAVDAYHLSGSLSTVGFVVGGAAAATGAVLLVVAPRPRPQRDAVVRPILGPGFVGAEGRF